MPGQSQGSYGKGANTVGASVLLQGRPLRQLPEEREIQLEEALRESGRPQERGEGTRVAASCTVCEAKQVKAEVGRPSRRRGRRREEQGTRFSSSDAATALLILGERRGGRTLRLLLTAAVPFSFFCARVVPVALGGASSPGLGGWGYP